VATALEVVLLGTGAPLYNPDRCGNGAVVIAGDVRVAVDLGWGTSRLMNAAGLLPASIGYACFTHMHSDHVTDTPDFLMQRWTGGARTPLKVYGPAGTRETVEAFRAGLRLDAEYRIAHHGEKQLPRSGFEVDIEETAIGHAPRTVASIGDLEIDIFEVDHRPVEPAAGYRFRRNGRTIVISGDTAKCDALVQASRSADLLVSEALNETMWSGMVNLVRSRGNERGASILSDVPSYHSTTLEVAEMARDAGVRHLVLSHLLPPPPAEGPALALFTAGMADIFSGQITVGADTQRFTIEE
jgi:ribonuclease Z